MNKAVPGLVLVTMAGLCLAGAACASKPAHDYPIRPVPFTDVRFTDGFWLPRLEVNHRVTIPHILDQEDKTGRFKNFDLAAGAGEGDFCSSYPFDDSDVYKTIEAAAYSLRLFPDPEMERRVDGLIARIAKAQEPDGYLYTIRTINPRKPKVDWAGSERWSNLSMSHELYNLGHLYEAAVAWKQATGRDDLLDAARKSFKLIDSVFGPGKRRDVPGHEEVEIGLVKLYRLTGNVRCLDLAKFFIDQRGRAEGHKLYGEYSQDHKPVMDQAEAVGHAVRAMYLYSGVADVAALTGDEAYVQAVDRIWEDVVGRKMYLTGGIGAVGGIEGFGPAYVLPNETAYAETCASIANALWNYRMFLLHGEAKYVDVLERLLYNGTLSGVSLSGDLFFYPNPLASSGQHSRVPWFNCACCPPNVARLIPSIPGFVYAEKEDSLYVNLFVQSESRLTVGDDMVGVRQETAYPWDGAVKIILDPEQAEEFAVHVRIPGWAQGRPVPTDLYTYVDAPAEPVGLKVNGQPVDPDLDKGYAVLNRVWKKGDTIELDLPMPVRRTAANSQVQADVGRVALERGPFVYCAEGPDNGGSVTNLVLPDTAALKAERRDSLLGGLTVIQGPVEALAEAPAAGSVTRSSRELTAIPYYAWANRGPAPMEVWIAREESRARPLPRPTIASRSRATASGGRTAIAVNDLWPPRSSNDHSHPYLHWWPAKGVLEWVQYEFPGPERVSSVEVYWFDDEEEGECRVPQSWRILYKEDGDWKPVAASGPYGLAPDRFNRVSFRPVRTSGLRLEVQLQKDSSAGVLEWAVK
jgi:DUF1680 family protein